MGTRWTCHREAGWSWVQNLTSAGSIPTEDLGGEGCLSIQAEKVIWSKPGKRQAPEQANDNSQRQEKTERQECRSRGRVCTDCSGPGELTVSKRVTLDRGRSWGSVAQAG